MNPSLSDVLHLSFLIITHNPPHVVLKKVQCHQPHQHPSNSLQSLLIPAPLTPWNIFLVPLDGNSRFKQEGHEGLRVCSRWVYERRFPLTHISGGKEGIIVPGVLRGGKERYEPVISIREDHSPSGYSVHGISQARYWSGYSLLQEISPA